MISGACQNQEFIWEMKKNLQRSLRRNNLRKNKESQRKCFMKSCFTVSNAFHGSSPWVEQHRWHYKYDMSDVGGVVMGYKRMGREELKRRNTGNCLV